MRISFLILFVLCVNGLQLFNKESSDFQNINGILEEIVDYYKIDTVLMISNTSISFEYEQMMWFKNNRTTKYIVYKPFNSKKLKMNKDSTMSVVYFTEISSRLLKNILSLKFMRNIKIVFIYMGDENHINRKMKLFFQFSQNQSMINSILIKNCNKKVEIYSYDPFPVVIKNLTNLPVEKYFRKSYLKNFNRHIFSTTFYGMSIRCMINLDENNQYKKERIIGSVGKTFIEFTKYVNLTYLVRLQRYNEFYDKFDSLYKNKKIDFTIEAFHVFPSIYYDTSYPFKMIEMCIMLPYDNEIPSYMYVIIAYKTEVWIMICVTVFYITIMLQIMKILKNKNDSDYVATLMEVISGLVFNAFPTDFRKHRDILIRLTYVLIMLLGFILTNIYLALSMSFLAKVVYKPQVNTIEEMIEAGIKISNVGNNTRDFLEVFKAPKELFNLLHDVPYVEEFNWTQKSYAFIDNDDVFEFQMERFKYSKRKYYRKSDICFRNGYLRFTSAYGSVLLEPMNFHILRVVESGLYDFWQRQMFPILKRLGQVSYFRDMDLEEYPRQMTLSHFKIVWLFWMFGLLISLICFAIEVIYFHRNKVKEKLSNIWSYLKRIWKVVIRYFRRTAQ